jgi:hypothetical protein
MSFLIKSLRYSVGINFIRVLKWNYTSKNNSEQKEKPLAGISLKMACGSKKALKIN